MKAFIEMVPYFLKRNYFKNSDSQVFNCIFWCKLNYKEVYLGTGFEKNDFNRFCIFIS